MGRWAADGWALAGVVGGAGLAAALTAGAVAAAAGDEARAAPVDATGCAIVMPRGPETVVSVHDGSVRIVRRREAGLHVASCVREIEVQVEVERRMRGAGLRLPAPDAPRPREETDRARGG